MIGLEKFMEIFSDALLTLKEQKLRSALTLLGIIAGIASIITLITLGQGITEAINQQFEKMGSNTLIIMPGKNFTATIFSKLKENDRETIEKIQNIDFVIPVYIETAQIEFRKEKKTSLVIGIDPKMQDSMGKIGLAELNKGRKLSVSDNFAVLIGSKIEKDYFDSEVMLRQKISFLGTNFRVVGLLKPASSALGSTYNSAVMLDYETLKKLKPGITPARLIVKTTGKTKNAGVKEEIIDRLTKSHGQEDFMVNSIESITETTSNILGIVQLVLLAIAAISLVVGGIGIMNTMLMSIIERTQEIGLMKATGATNSQVLAQFITEAGIIGITGGTIGIITGTAVSFAVSAIAKQNGFEIPVQINFLTAAGTLLFAFIIGMASGTYPAYRAAKMDPVDALRK